MRGTRSYFGKASAVIVIGAMLWESQTAKAGWTGLINGTGYGWASANVRSVTLHTNKATTGYLTGPSASISPTTGYAANNVLPSGASPYTTSKIKGLAGGIWSAQTAAYSGDGADNAELDARVTVVPAFCATLTMDTSIDINQFNANGHSGIVTVNTTGSAGTALWLRGFEYTNNVNFLPLDNPDTPENETVEFLKTNGVWKFEVVLLGPFDFGSNNCPLLIPFTLDSGSLSNLIFVADGTAKSVPFSIQCPADLTPACNQTVHYPPIKVTGGCGNTTITFSVPDGTPFPITTTPVTVTATDQATNTVSCTFNVTVTDTNAPVPPPLPDIISSTCNITGVTPLTPVATDNCDGSVLGKTTNQFPITTLGTNIVYWTFTDSHGNTSTATQRVIVNGLTFLGFYSPINGTGGTCSSPLRTINTGSVIPIKFDIKCGSTLITSGTPPIVRIQRWSSQCGFISEPIDANAVYNNDWHFNWDTTGWKSGVYQVIAVLPDGTSRYVWVTLK